MVDRGRGLAGERWEAPDETAAAFGAAFIFEKRDGWRMAIISADGELLAEREGDVVALRGVAATWVWSCVEAARDGGPRPSADWVWSARAELA